MCGIAGFAATNEGWSPELLKPMVDRLAHRGPDDHGMEHAPGVSLGHRRLSILDLSAAGHQPMYSADQRHILAFNGEVFNFKELAEKGHYPDLHSSGDTVVVLEALRREGVEALKAFNGMFALAFWDADKRELVLARDRMGIKPLYYAELPGGLAFASELKALLAFAPLRQRRLDPAAVHAFLHLGYIPHPYSIYQGIRTLPPGHVLRFRAGKASLESYWSLDAKLEEAQRHGAQQPASSPEQAEAQLHALLRSSVGFRLQSDVPLGTFLSGGIDSSLVTALAAEQTNRTLHTFSIGFEEAKFDESAYAQKVAAHLGTEHHAYTLTYAQARERFEDILGTYDEPFGDSSSIPTMLVSELAAQTVKVILTGDGGDETHLGYGSYTWADRLGKASWRTAAPLLRLGMQHMPSRYQRVAALLDLPEAEHRPSHIFSQELYAFSRKELSTLLAPLGSANWTMRQWSPGQQAGNTSATQQSLFDAHHYLPDDLLVKVDRASMRVGLECRVPLLDHRLVEFAFGLPAEWRAGGGVSKKLLKAILARYVPRELFERPKWGFGLPVGEWLKGPWKGLVEDYLQPTQLEAAGLVNPDLVAQLLRRFRGGEDYLYFRIWLLVLLHRWHAGERG